MNPEAGRLMDILAELTSMPDRLERQTPYGRVVFFNRPADVTAVLAEARLIRTELLKTALGEGLLASDGQLWRSQRRTLQRFFGPGHVERFARIVGEVLSEKLPSWAGKRLDLSREMTLLTLEVIVRAVFGLRVGDEGPELAEAISHVIHDLGKIASTLFGAPLVMTPDFSQRLNGAVQRLDRFAEELMARRRAEPSEDLVSLLLSEPTSDKQVRDEIVSMLISGHETTALTLSWGLSLLDDHPRARARLEEETDRVLAGRLPGVEDLEQLVYTRWVLQETMRLYPPVWFMARRASTDLTVADHSMPRGTTAVVAPYLVHRHPQEWEEPEAFRPERFEPEVAKKRSRHAYLPFGGGRHICLGQKASLAEGIMVLAALVGRYRLCFEAPAGRPEPVMTLRHGGEVPVVMEVR